MLVNHGRRDQGKPAIPFLLSDKNPDVPAWIEHAVHSDHLTFIPSAVDAAEQKFFTTDGRLSEEEGSKPSLPSRTRPQVFRLFCMAFHDFDDDTAIPLFPCEPPTHAHMSSSSSPIDIATSRHASGSPRSQHSNLTSGLQKPRIDVHHDETVMEAPPKPRQESISMLGTTPVLAELGLGSGVALCSNGAVTLDAATGEALAVETFDPAPVHARLAALLPGAIFAAEQIGTGSLVTSPFREYQLHGPQRLTALDELVAAPVPRLIANWADHEPGAVAEALAGVELPGCTVTIDHYEPWVTVVPAGVTKGAALEKLRTELGVAAEDTFAAGDGTNDVQMLRWAAHGVAMGQAPEEVRAAAAEVTGPVTEDGVVTALTRWFA